MTKALAAAEHVGDDAPEEDTAPTRPDHEISGCPVITGAPTAMVARRILCKAAKSAEPEKLIVSASRCHTLFGKTEMENKGIGKVSIYAFKHISLACPPRTREVA